MNYRQFPYLGLFKLNNKLLKVSHNFTISLN